MPKTNIVKKVRLSRGEQNARRSEELLEAAWTVFCDKGYESVTIDDVAAQAGYSRMPIYSLFGDKQSLFFALWQRTIDRSEEHTSELQSLMRISYADFCL